MKKRGGFGQRQLVAALHDAKAREPACHAPANDLQQFETCQVLLEFRCNCAEVWRHSSFRTDVFNEHLGLATGANGIVEVVAHGIAVQMPASASAVCHYVLCATLVRVRNCAQRPDERTRSLANS